MTHLFIPSFIGVISLLSLLRAFMLRTYTDSTSHPTTDAIRNLVSNLYLSASGSLLIFAALPEYSFIIHFAFNTSVIPFTAGLLYIFFIIYMMYSDVRENGMEVLMTDILTLLCLAMLPVLLVGAIPYQPWMTPVGTLILIGNMVMTQATRNKRKRLASGTSAA